MDDAMYEGDGGIVLTTDDGQEIEFIELANIEMEGRIFSVMQPSEHYDWIDDDEVIIFEVTENEDGEQSFVMVEDDNLADEVFAEYEKLVENDMN
ncbi:MAG: DUF1292 domain-containing protein [Clostridia bacterium]|nr:DUF1292 domain-containing protein [Clostridia bacterium]